MDDESSELHYEFLKDKISNKRNNVKMYNCPHFDYRPKFTAEGLRYVTCKRFIYLTQHTTYYKYYLMLTIMSE